MGNAKDRVLVVLFERCEMLPEKGIEPAENAKKPPEAEGGLAEEKLGLSCSIKPTVPCCLDDANAAAAVVAANEPFNTSSVFSLIFPTSAFSLLFSL